MKLAHRHSSRKSRLQKHRRCFLASAPGVLLLTVPSLLHAQNLITVTNGAADGTGSLNAAISQANSNSAANPTATTTINFTSGLTSISLQGGEQLFVNANVTINGGSGVTINAAGTDRIFFVAGGTVNMNNLTLENGFAGGGSSGFGGGGAGLGGALFVANGKGIAGSNVTLATNVTLSQITFHGNEAVGGSSNIAAQEDGFGGGGMGGNGGVGNGMTGDNGAGDGGGGFGIFAEGGGAVVGDGGNGAFAGGSTAGNGGGGFAGNTGGGGSEEGLGFGGGGGGVAGSNAQQPNIGGNGGFGGGGGGGAVTGGNGGFGGGGGLGLENPAGKGGFGGGGAGGSFDGNGTGGFGAGSGGNNGGGGGLGAGGAIFVQDGASLTVVGGSFSGDDVKAGLANGIGGTNGEAYGSGMFLLNTIEIAAASGNPVTVGEDIYANDSNPNDLGTTTLPGLNINDVVNNGTVTLSGNNNYAGATTLNNGTLILGSNNALGSSVLTAHGQTVGYANGVHTNNAFILNSNLNLDAENSVSAEQQGSISTSGGVFGVTKTGAGTLTLGGADTVTAAVNAGTLQIGDGSGDGSIIPTAGDNPGFNAITVNAGSLFDDKGNIQGGLGGSFLLFGAAGGTAVTLASAGTIVTNSGSITGGAGGEGNNGSGLGVGGTGGTGVAVSDGGTVINNSGGTIAAGAAGPGGSVAGNPGVGVQFTNAAGTLSNAGTITGGVSMGNFANSVTLFTGSHIVGALNIGTSTSATLTLDGSGTQSYIAAATGVTTFNGSLVKQGSGTWTLDQAFSYSGGATVTSGELIAAVPGALPVNTALTIGTSALAVGHVQLAAGIGRQLFSSLTINSGSQLDITNNAVGIDFPSPANDPITAIAAELASGYNAGTWTGTGITSSTAAANASKFAVGYLDGNADAAAVAKGTVSPNLIVFKYTLAGDAYLENSVGFDDLIVVAQHYGTTGWDWAGGDFNYDPNGSVGFADLVDVAKNYGLSSGVNNGAPGSSSLLLQATALNASVVPEPDCIALAAGAAIGLLSRRRRRAR